MNERFKTLWFEAAESKNGDSWAEQTEFMEKFAELIVRECAVVADQWVNDEDNGHNLVSERLRQHFGVES